MCDCPSLLGLHCLAAVIAKSAMLQHDNVIVMHGEMCRVGRQR